MGSTLRHYSGFRFGTFELDPTTRELRKNGVKLKLGGQPFQVLTVLLERPGEIVTREELEKRIWPGTFVDFEHNLNTAINRIREVLGDSADSPRFVETVPRRGYRFIAPVDGVTKRPTSCDDAVQPTDSESHSPFLVRRNLLSYVVGGTIVAALAVLLFGFHDRTDRPVQRTLTRISFGTGLELEPTWSPDGQLMAYASDQGGKLDIWVQQAGGGNPVQVTHAPGNNWQPSWSPDGKYIAYRSEAGAGLFMIPALGSDGQGRRISSFGYRPQWSPDGTQILFQTLTGLSTPKDTYYVVSIEGGGPKVVLGEFVAQHPGSMAWYPDGERVSLWEKRWDLARSSPNLWIVGLRDGTAKRLEIAPEVAKQIEVVSGGNQTCDVGDSFAWAPSGQAAYFACEYRGATNIWKMILDSKLMRATRVERLTTGAGSDEDPAVSSDERRIAFSSKSKRVRVWLFPLDVSSGRLRGPGSAVTSAGSQAYEPSLSPDGKKLAFSVLRSRNWEIWEKFLPDGREMQVVAGDYNFEYPQWSRDSKQLVYRGTHAEPGTALWHFGLWSDETRTEEPLTGNSSFGTPYDWWLDDKSILISRYNPSDGSAEIQRLWVANMPRAEESAKTLASRPGYALWQAHISSDGKRVVFMAVSPQPESAETSIYVMPSEGGSWVRITGGNHWTDKPRWSADGKLIYYVTEKDGFLNVWAIHFNTLTRKAEGKPFQVTSFESPSLMFPSSIESSDISLAPGKLAMTLQETSGSVWVLDNIE